MDELNDFYYSGTGWICRQCERELAGSAESQQKYSRAFTEGEAESKSPELAQAALARWTDKTRRFLMCPRCGITESVERS